MSLMRNPSGGIPYISQLEGLLEVSYLLINERRCNGTDCDSNTLLTVSFHD